MIRHASMVLALVLSACGSSDDEGAGGGGAGGGIGGAGGDGASAGAGGSGASAGAGGSGASAGSGDGGTGGSGASPADCTPAASTEQAVMLYGEAWNETDADARLCLLRRSLVDDVTYVDPTIDTTTVEALSDAIGAFIEQVPDGSIEMRSGLDARDDDMRFAWDFMNAGVVAVPGEDYVEIADDGRLSSIRGYWDPYPDPAPHPALDAYVAAWTEADATAREASLGDALSTDARMTGPDGLDVTGAAAISAAMGDLGATAVVVDGVQIYPKYARVALTITATAGATTVTDYAHLDASGKLSRIGRFAGEFPPLP